MRLLRGTLALAAFAGAVALAGPPIIGFALWAGIFLLARGLEERVLDRRHARPTALQRPGCGPLARAVWDAYEADRLSLDSAVLRIEALYRARLEEIDGQWDGVDWDSPPEPELPDWWRWNGDALEWLPAELTTGCGNTAVGYGAITTASDNVIVPPPSQIAAEGVLLPAGCRLERLGP